MNDVIDSLRAIRVFVRVAETRSFTSAANELDLPRSSATQLIQRLEHQLGVALLHRSTRNVSMTEAGERFYEKALTLLDAARVAETSVVKADQAPLGHLVVSASVTLAREFLAPHLPHFLENYPDITLALRVENRQIDLIVEDVDIALRFGAQPQGDVRAVKVADISGGLVAAPSYVSRHGLPLDPDALQQHTLIAQDTRHRQLQWRLVSGDQRITLQQRARFAADEIGVIASTVRAGMGIGWLPDSMITEDLARGTLLRVMPHWQLVTALEFWLIYRERRFQSAAMDAFMNFVLQRFAPP